MHIHYRLLLLAGLVAAGGVAPAAEVAHNLVRNPGFEEPLEGVWEQRTPSDSQRSLERRTGPAHAGNYCLALENRDGKPTRLRQGHDRTLTIAPGSLVELSAWIKPDLGDQGRAGVQFYCMGDEGQILAQPRTDAPAPRGDWQSVRLLAKVPEGTRSTMVYLQTDRAAGTALFDDVRLHVVRRPPAAAPVAKIGVLSDLPPDDECLRSVKTLLGAGFSELPAAAPADVLAGCAGAVVLLRASQLPPATAEALAAFAREGHSVFMDLRAFAAWRNVPLVESRLDGAPNGSAASRPQNATQQQMQTGLTVVRATSLSAGFSAGQIVPYAAANGHLLHLGALPAESGIEVLATAAGQPALVALNLGRGRIVAADLLSLREPHVGRVDAYYKYLFLANTLATPQRIMLGEYYPRKLAYAEFVEQMRELARRHPTVRLQDEGPASADYRIYSLNLGRADGPLYFLYAAAHGSEWEPGYGLLTFARHLAEGRLKESVDLNKVAVKIIPILNPSGYDLRQRQNAQGVDLNRQGDQAWEAYRGKDSNGDGSYGPHDYDWKGAAPFTEPEARVYQRIVQAPQLWCTLDFHGNSSALSNKLVIVPATAKEDALWRAIDLQELVNSRLHLRYVLKQADEERCSPYRLERVYRDSDRPVLHNTGARGRYGVLVELTAGYADAYGTVLQTEVTCEICRALLEVFPPER